MVATYWPSTCVFNKLYLENLLAPLRHTFPITTFSRVDDYWLVLPWGHDQSTVSVLAGYDRGHVCNLGTTLTKYFSKRQTGITVLWMLHDDVIKWKHFFALLVLCEGNPPPVNEGFPSQRPVKRSFNIFYIRMNKRLKANSRDDGASRHHRAHYDVTVNDLRNKKKSVWSERNAFSKDRLWSQLIDRLRACSMRCILKIYWLFYATPFH